MGIGAAQYTSAQSAAAYHYFATLEVTAPEADAERLYYQMG